MNQEPIEPPTAYSIVFKQDGLADGQQLGRVTYRISRKVIDQIADDFRTGVKVGCYDVEALDGSYRKLIFHFEDVAYIG